MIFKEVLPVKKFFISFIFMLTLLICCIFSANAAEYDIIKVGLYYGSSAQSSVTLTANLGISYGWHNGDKHIELSQITAQSFTIRTLNQSQIIINESIVFDTNGMNLSVVPLEGNLRLNGKEYRGGMLFTNVSDTQMSVINILPTEEYLYGVVPGEMPSSWDEEALKAQAICARGFAISNYNKHISQGFNVCATTNCQVYSGVGGEARSTTKAVDETYGEVVMYDGKPIESLFFSSSGGHTANAKNVWGTYISYLSGVEDSYEPEDSPRHSWSATLSFGEIEEALEKSNIDVGSVESLSAKSDETGRVYELTVKGSEGTHVLKRGSTYSPFVSYGVISQKFSISPILSGGGNLYAKSSLKSSKLASYTALGGNATVVTLGDSFTIKSNKKTENYTAGSTDGYTFTGGGWGHGVGLSQYGAKGMADAGFDYTEILNHYYPGTYVESLYQPERNNDF